MMATPEVGTRACLLCVYRSPADTCWHPCVCRGNGPRALTLARCADGACGVDAALLTIPGRRARELQHMRDHDRR